MSKKVAEKYNNACPANHPSLDTGKCYGWPYYNWHRPHGAHKGKTPIEKYFTLSDKTPFWEEVEAGFDPSKERIQEANYWLDQQIRKLK